MIALVRELYNGADVEAHETAARALLEAVPAAVKDDVLLMVDDTAGGGLAILLTDTSPDASLIEIQRYDVRLSAGEAYGGSAAQVFSVQLQPGAFGEMVSAFQNLTMRAATGQEGFVRGLLLIDEANDRALSIGIWEDMALLEASAASGYLAEQVSSYLPYFREIPTERRLRVVQPS